MRKIAVVALLHALVSSPVLAADDMSPELNLEIPSPPLDEAARVFVERLAELGRFSLLQQERGFSLYGQIIAPRLAGGMSRNVAAYGLHAQFDGAQGVGLHFGWDHNIAGRGGSRYSLEATIPF